MLEQYNLNISFFKFCNLETQKSLVFTLIFHQTLALLKRRTMRVSFLYRNAVYVALENMTRISYYAFHFLSRINHSTS
jgi:hypothetical protein